MNNRLVNKGFSVSSYYLGDKMALCRFESESDCISFIKNHFFLDDCFASIKRWAFSIVTQSSMMWIEFTVVLLDC